MICVTCGEEFENHNPIERHCPRCRRLISSEKPHPEYMVESLEMQQQRICPSCGEAYLPRSANQIYCSEKCKKRAKRLREGKQQLKERDCKMCGKPFMPRYNIEIYCCNDCRAEADRKRDQEYTQKRKKKREEKRKEAEANEQRNQTERQQPKKYSKEAINSHMKSIGETAAYARTKGMSCGQLMAQRILNE